MRDGSVLVSYFMTDNDSYTLRTILLVNQSQVRTLAKHFPPEEHDTFYSHTQRAFSQGNLAEIDGRVYVFTCKRFEKNRIEVRDKNVVNVFHRFSNVFLFNGYL